MTDQTDSLKAAYFTLGCKLNFSETSTIGKILSSKGITRAAKGRLGFMYCQHLFGDGDGRQEGAASYPLACHALS